MSFKVGKEATRVSFARSYLLAHFVYIIYISSFVCPLFDCRYTDEDKLLAQPGPCTVEVMEAADLTQKAFLSRYKSSPIQLILYIDIVGTTSVNPTLN